MQKINCSYLILSLLGILLGFGTFACSGNGGVLSITLNNVNDPFCQENTYATAFTNFDKRQGQTQVRLTQMEAGSNTLLGVLTLPVAETNVLVYIFCDDSQGIDAYDQDNFFDMDKPLGPPPPNLVDYTNNGNFNACPREMVSLPDNKYPTTIYSYTGYPYTSFLFPETWDFRDFGDYLYYSNPFDPFVAGLVAENGIAPGLLAPGDRFTSVMMNGGESAQIDFEDLEFLGDRDHSGAEGGTLSQWCNCILGNNHYYPTYSFIPIFTTPTSYPGYMRYKVSGSLHHYFFNSIGFFTDSRRNDDGFVGKCIFP